jgi:transposase, IS5 family
VAFGDAGYTGVEKRPEARHSPQWHVAMKPGKRRALGASPYDRILERIEKLKAQVRARGEHAFRVVKRQFGYGKLRYRGLAKNIAQLHMLFALANIWMAHRRLLCHGIGACEERAMPKNEGQLTPNRPASARQTGSQQKIIVVESARTD